MHRGPQLAAAFADFAKRPEFARTETKSPRTATSHQRETWTGAGWANAGPAAAERREPLLDTVRSDGPSKKHVDPIRYGAAELAWLREHGMRWDTDRRGRRLPSSHDPGVGDNLWDRIWVNRKREPWLTVYMKDGRIYVGPGVEFALTSETREILLGNDTSMYDKEWNPIRELPRGEGVWIPVAEVSSIDIHE